MDHNSHFSPHFLKNKRHYWRVRDRTPMNASLILAGPTENKGSTPRVARPDPREQSQRDRSPKLQNMLNLTRGSTLGGSKDRNSGWTPEHWHWDPVHFFWQIAIGTWVKFFHNPQGVGADGIWCHRHLGEVFHNPQGVGADGIWCHRHLGEVLPQPPGRRSRRHLVCSLWLCQGCRWCTSPPPTKVDVWGKIYLSFATNSFFGGWKASLALSPWNPQNAHTWIRSKRYS